MKKILILMEISFLLFILFSCDKSEDLNNIKSDDYNLPKYFPPSTYELIGSLHNEICAHIMDLDSAVSISRNRGELLDSIISYIRFMYPKLQYPELNEGLDSAFNQITYRTSENLQIFYTPDDEISHVTYFTEFDFSETYQYHHLIIDSIVNDENLTIIQMCSSLIDYSFIVDSEDTLTLNDKERFGLLSQIYIAKYSANYWDLTYSSNKQRKGEINLLQTDNERKAMNKDINKHDEEAFASCFHPYWVYRASRLGGAGVAALAGAAVVYASLVSLERWGEIKYYGWYNS